LNSIELRAPYLILIGDNEDPTFAKTGLGIVQWRRDRVAGQLRCDGCEVDLGVPDMTVKQAKESGVRTLIIGVAPVGGIVPDSWWNIVAEAAMSGIDIVCGLHIRLNEVPNVAAAAKSSGARLIDIRVPPKNIPIGTGMRRSGKRLLTVGTDCAVGKKYSALALHQAMQESGLKATFRATGQTGIMVTGSGIPMDAVVGDFLSGAAEILSPDNADDHWDVIEGQGSLHHPAYAAVSLGLLLGSQPDTIVVCHDANRAEISGWSGFAVPCVSECIERNLVLGRLTNPDIRCIGVCINTSALPSEARQPYLDALRDETDLPCADPIIDGCAEILGELS